MTRDAYHTEVYKGYRIVLHADSDPENPRKGMDNLGTMVCFHRRYNLGDEHNYSNPMDLLVTLGVDEEEIGVNPTDDLGDGSKLRIVWEPLYLYDHSGITMKTTPFSCPWDSGQVGIIYVTYARIAQEENVPEAERSTWVPTAEQIAQYETILKGEVEVYDTYIRGDVLGYRIYEKADASEEDDDLQIFTEEDDEFWNEDDEDSCWGFYGQEDALEAAKEVIDAMVNEDETALSELTTTG